MRKTLQYNDLFNRLTSYLSGCKAALYPTYNQAEINTIMRPFNQTALRAFIDALPDDISGSVDRHDPIDLATALTYAKQVCRNDATANPNDQVRQTIVRFRDQ